MNDATDKPRRINVEWREKSPKKPWITAILAVLLIYFLLFIGRPLVNGDWCRAIDYCGYYGAGLTMNNGKIADIYNSQILGQFQSDFFLQLALLHNIQK